MREAGLAEASALLVLLLSLSGALVGDVGGSLEALGLPLVGEPGVPGGLVAVTEPGYYNVSCGQPGLRVAGEALEGGVRAVFECGGVLVVEDSIIYGEVVVESRSGEPVYVVVRNSTLDGLIVRGQGVAGAWVSGSRLGLLYYEGPPSTYIDGVPHFTVVELRDSVLDCRGSLSVIIPGHVVIEGLEACGANISLTAVSTVIDGLSAVNGSRVDVWFSAFALLRNLLVHGSVALEAPGGVSPEPYRWLLVEDSRITRGGGFNVSATQSVFRVEAPARPFAAENLTLQASRVELWAPWILVQDSLVSTGSLLVEGAALAGIAGTRLSLAASHFTLAPGSLVVVEGVEARLSSPIRVMPGGDLNLTINASSLTCPSSCIAIHAPGEARVGVGVWDTVFHGRGAAVTVYSTLPPGALARIATGDSYYSGPAGPTVSIGGQVLRKGGMGLIVAGWARGSVIVESWLATPQGPRLEASGPPEGVEASPLEAGTVYYASAPHAPAVIIVYEEASPTHILRLQGASVVDALTEVGRAEIEVLDEGIYLARAEAPYRQLLLTIAEPREQAGEGAGEEEAETVETATTTTQPRAPGGEARSLQWAIAAALAVAVAAAIYWVFRAPRGRPRG